VTGYLVILYLATTVGTTWLLGQEILPSTRPVSKLTLGVAGIPTFLVPALLTTLADRIRPTSPLTNGILTNVLLWAIGIFPAGRSTKPSVTDFGREAIGRIDATGLAESSDADAAFLTVPVPAAAQGLPDAANQWRRIWEHSAQARTFWLMVN